MKNITIAHLYPAEMNIYGDRGNVICLVKRLQWRGYHPVVEPVTVGGAYDFGKADIVFGGGGQDTGQALVAEDLLKRKAQINKAVAHGMPMLLICGTYQLFGQGFTTVDGQKLQGIGVFNASTTGSDVRMIGNVVVDSDFGQLVGFENHSGQTTLGPGQPALGKVSKGHGNNSESKVEGAVVNNAFGTYLHGPLLPKNPQLADHLILSALQRRGLGSSLKPLDDTLELAAAAAAKKRPQ